jgi:predicted outer membrane repeat protein
MRHLLAKLRAKWVAKGTIPAGRRRRPPLRCESLETRCVPTVVTTSSDALAHTGVSLRDALASTPSGGTITFANSALGTISLAQGELAVPKSVFIKGPGAGLLAIDAHTASRIFDLTGTNETVAIFGLTLENGSAAEGGAILFSDPGDKVTVSAAVLKNNQSDGNGGAISGEGSLTLQNSTLSGNSATGSESGGLGGGFYMNGTAAVTNCTFKNNYAYDGGGLDVVGAVTIRTSKFTGNVAYDSAGGVGVGGLYQNTTSKLVVVSSTFSGNHAGNSGGAIGDNYGDLSFGGPMNVTGCTFTGNAADSGGALADFDASSRAVITLVNDKMNGNTADNGGAVLTFGETMIRGCSISGNSSGNSGGGVISTGALTIQSSTISGNHCANGGGGVEAFYSLNATNSTFANNTAGNLGGGILSLTYLDTTIRACTISGNTATNGGGGIFSEAYDFTLINSTVVSNTAALATSTSTGPTGGGGIWLYTTAARIENSTIALNRVTLAGSAGGGILASSETLLLLVSSIVANDKAPSGNDISVDQVSDVVANFCLIKDNTGLTLDQNSSNNIFHLDPLLGPLANNGGPTLTMLPAAGSLVLGHGSNPDNLPTDQRGFPRSLNGVTDIGAVQAEQPSTSTGHRGQR